MSEPSSEPEQRSPTAALVTPSYRPDLARCETLVESVERFGPGLHHYLVVDRRDRRHFQHLESPDTSILTSEELLGGRLRRLPSDRSIWVSPTHRPVRGWIVQQVLKLSMPEHLNEDVLVFCDSDTAFIRPFGIDDFLISGKPGLLDVDYQSPDVHRWTDTACALFGLDVADVPVRNHVGNMICWRRDIALAMLELIRERGNRKWQTTLLKQSSISEYMLYGVFVRSVIGYEAAGHVPSTIPLVKPSWEHDIKSSAGLDEFFSEFEPETIAVMLHSKDNVPVTEYRHHLERIWASTDPDGPITT